MTKRITTTAGFTLVEIMIVVAIIALLAGIAVPNYLRARKRAQATSILEEMRVLEGAEVQYAIEWNVAGSQIPTFLQLQPYLKVGSRLESSGGLDDLGNTIRIRRFDRPPQINAATRNNFTDVIEDPALFWGSYSR